MLLPGRAPPSGSAPLSVLLVWCLLAAAAAGPTFLVTGPQNIRPGANVTIGVTLLTDSPPQVTVRGEVLRGNDTVLHGEVVFEKGTYDAPIRLCSTPLGQRED